MLFNGNLILDAIDPLVKQHESHLSVDTLTHTLYFKLLHPKTKSEVNCKYALSNSPLLREVDIIEEGNVTTTPVTFDWITEVESNGKVLAVVQEIVTRYHTFKDLEPRIIKWLKNGFSGRKSIEEHLSKYVYTDTTLKMYMSSVYAIGSLLEMDAVGNIKYKIKDDKDNEVLSIDIESGEIILRRGAKIANISFSVAFKEDKPCICINDAMQLNVGSLSAFSRLFNVVFLNKLEELGIDEEILKTVPKLEDTIIRIDGYYRCINEMLGKHLFEEDVTTIKRYLISTVLYILNVNFG